MVDGSNHDSKDGEGGDDPPCRLPIDAGTFANHLLEVVGESLVAVDVTDDDCFKERNDDEAHGTGEGVEHANPVFSSARAENQTDQKGN